MLCYFVNLWAIWSCLHKVCWYKPSPDIISFLFIHRSGNAHYKKGEGLLECYSVPNEHSDFICNNHGISLRNKTKCNEHNLFPSFHHLHDWCICCKMTLSLNCALEKMQALTASSSWSIHNYCVHLQYLKYLLKNHFNITISNPICARTKSWKLHYFLIYSTKICHAVVAPKTNSHIFSW